MPNNISNSTQSSLNTPIHIQQQLTSSNQGIIKNITKLSNQALSRALPMNEMEDILSSSATKRKNLENKYPGEVKRKYEPTREGKIIDSLSNAADFDTPGKVCNQPLSFEILPAELIQNIAFKLDARNYFNLRSTSYGMRETLPSFEDINKAFINECSWGVKKNRISIYNKTIMLQLEKEKNHDLLNTLKSISVISSGNLEELSGHILSMKFMVCDSVKSNYHDSPDESDSDISENSYRYILKEWDYHILDEWCGMVTECSNYKELDTRITHEKFSPECYSFACDTTRFVFDANKIEEKYLGLFIDSFSTLFIEYGDKERLIVAIAAHRLIEALKVNTPANITKDNILQYKSKYPIMFGLGAALDNYLSTENQKTSSNYFKHPDYTH